MVEGIDTVPSLRARLIELVTSVPGYTEYCQHQRQIENGTYCLDATLRQQLTFEPADYEKSSWKVHNDKKDQTASRQTLQAITRVIDDGMVYSSQNVALEALRAYYDGPCRRWWWKTDNAKYKKFWIAYSEETSIK